MEEEIVDYLSLALSVQSGSARLAGKRVPTVDIPDRHEDRPVDQHHDMREANGRRVEDAEPDRHVARRVRKDIFNLLPEARVVARVVVG